MDNNQFPGKNNKLEFQCKVAEILELFGRSIEKYGMNCHHVKECVDEIAALREECRKLYILECRPTATGHQLRLLNMPLPAKGTDPLWDKYYEHLQWYDGTTESLDPEFVAMILGELVEPPKKD